MTGLANGTPYTFTVTATNAAGTGPASDASAAATPVSPPVSPPVASISGLPTWLAANSVPVRWGATAGTSPVATYDVRYRRAAWNGTFGGYTTWLAGNPDHECNVQRIARVHVLLLGTSARHGERRVAVDSRGAAIPLDDRSLTRSGN